MFMERGVLEIAGGRSPPPRLVKGVGTKRLGKGRVKVAAGPDCSGNANLPQMNKPASKKITLRLLDISSLEGKELLQYLSQTRVIFVQDAQYCFGRNCVKIAENACVSVAAPRGRTCTLKVLSIA